MATREQMRRIEKQTERNKRIRNLTKQWLGYKRQLKQLRRKDRAIKGRQKKKIPNYWYKRIDVVEDAFSSQPEKVTMDRLFLSFKEIQEMSKKTTTRNA